MNSLPMVVPQQRVKTSFRDRAREAWMTAPNNVDVCIIMRFPCYLPGETAEEMSDRMDAVVAALVKVQGVHDCFTEERRARGLYLEYQFFPNSEAGPGIMQLPLEEVYARLWKMLSKFYPIDRCV
jgi:hypothetical protein